MYKCVTIIVNHDKLVGYSIPPSAVVIISNNVGLIDILELFFGM